MEKPKLMFFPKFEGAIKGWAIKYIHKNLWRVESYHTFDDLVQDAYEYFLICSGRYSSVSNPKHFMSLFQRCLINHFHDLARQREQFSTVLSVESLQTEDDYTDAEMLALLDGPTVVNELALLLSNPTTPENKERKTTNQYWCELLNIDPSTDIRSMVHQHFVS